MFLSMNWISDFVDLSGLDKMQLISQFSLSTAEVESEIFYKGKDVEGVVVAQIKEVLPHPESKKLHLLKVDAGEGQFVDVVCGAPNVRVGMKTAFAKVGARLGEITIASRMLAGYPSNGMCCSEKEIGISDDHSGIMEITDDIANGTDLKSVYAIDDIIFEVDNKSVTNRPDLWGHYGIAREFAALAGRPLKEPETVDLHQYDGLPAVDMKIEDPLCQRYACLQVENINKNVSPVNMRIRLYYCGMRAINLLADITNYIMLEMGQPMHAFDSRKVGKIRIKRFDQPFRFTTLDGVERKMDEDMLMICNDNTPVAIAGIMGGLDSEIVEDTTTLTLESATFDPVSIRKTSVRLSHRTDASARYEKSLDPEMAVTAIGRFMKLLLDVDGGVKVVSSLTDEYPFHYPPVSFTFDKKFIDKYTGIDISGDSIEKILTSLQFGVARNGDDFSVTVPSWRATKDVTIKADIVEEIARIYGYDNFDVHTAKAPLYPVRVMEEKSVEDKVKDLLVKRYSLHEVHSYIWAYYDEYKALNMEVEDNVKLVGSTNVNIETLRRSIIPTQLCQIKYNTSYSADFGIFEIGRTVDGVDPETNLCREYKKLAVTLFSKTKSTEALYMELCRMLAVMADDIRHQPVTFVKKEATHSYQHPKNLNSVCCGGKEIGEIGVITPGVSKKIDKKAAIVYAELDVNLLSAVEDLGLVYEEPSRYPEIEVDLTFVADLFAPIGKAISEAKSKLLKGTKLVDVYNDEAGKSITVKLTFFDNEKTLTREEVMADVDKIIGLLENDGIKLKQ